MATAGVLAGIASAERYRFDSKRKEKECARQLPNRVRSEKILGLSEFDDPYIIHDGRNSGHFQAIKK